LRKHGVADVHALVGGFGQWQADKEPVVKGRIPRQATALGPRRPDPTFHVTVPGGGSNGMMSACSMGMAGQATMSSDGHTMAGTHSGSTSGTMSGGMMGQSCGNSMNNGQFTVTR
jgi:hypothetical protein